VIVCDFDLTGISRLPSETDPVLIINSDAVLSVSVAPKPFQSIPWWNGELEEVPDVVDLVELSSSHAP